MQDVMVVQLERDDPLFSSIFLDDKEDIGNIWQVFITTRDGLRPEDISIISFSSPERAEAFKNEHPVGSLFDGLRGNKSIDHEFIKHQMRCNTPLSVAAGDEESPLALDVLRAAGLRRDRHDIIDGESDTTHEGAGNISDEVERLLGIDRLDELKVLFGVNWHVAAIFEFCWLNIPHSSPAFAAASYQYHHYITGDDFSAGYHWRDLEIMAHDVEVLALKTIQMRIDAGQSGSRKSKDARRQRQAELLKKMEELASTNPDFAEHLPAADVAKLAAKQCAAKNPRLWAQGQGQVKEYVDEIRRGEAGLELKARYQKIFGDKVPKRLSRRGQGA